ncbi:MAG: Potassium-transporting ATPase A chain [Brockia lithotrophica]|uniref:Potassium-transporting ATPase potassium-binding subunit n=1 Tax=Brockia lithotrophica TaxID=933949 RepID=A0A2T5G4R3_9BACL|nr:potassium-transporting ATPase subunit KdpA [Brockia lithotrophica]PTQ51187.1 MAG: Potassium-transporting ATPase A chain [Brockia lithotrophica]
MNVSDFVEVLSFVLLVTALMIPTGNYLYRLMEAGEGPLGRVFLPLERPLYRLMGVDPDAEMDFRAYAKALVFSNLFMMLLGYVVFRLQAYLPLNPDGIPNQSPDLAFNTAASFITNTNWQSYSGETAMSILGQMLGITFLMTVSAATGIVAALAAIRGIRGERSLGNFYRDFTRVVVRFLLPVSFVAALLYVAEGMPQTLLGRVTATTLDGSQQVIARGPVASLEAIKHLGTNGGGYFGANAAHPYENPTPLTNLVHMLLMMLVPTSLLVTFGRATGKMRLAWLLYVGVLVIFLAHFAVVYAAETWGTPALRELGVQGGNFEGKEVRFGIVGASLFTTVTTAATTGSVDNMHDSLTPLGGMIPLFQMMLNTVFGGVGAGFLNILMYVLLTAFLSGLLVGRTPEFLGRKIEPKEMKLLVIALLMHPLLILSPTALALALPGPRESILNPSFHGISEVAYAYASGAANNGSAFAGLNAATPFYNITIGLVMLFGRFVSLLALVAVAASLGQKRVVPESTGTLKVDTPLFASLVVFVIWVVGGLTFFPVLALGPLAEHFTMLVQGVAP